MPTWSTSIPYLLRCICNPPISPPSTHQSKCPYTYPSTHTAHLPRAPSPPSSSRRIGSPAGWASPSPPLPEPLRSARAARCGPFIGAASLPPPAPLPGTAAPGLPHAPGGAAGDAVPPAPWSSSGAPWPLAPARAHFPSARPTPRPLPREHPSELSRSPAHFPS